MGQVIEELIALAREMRQAEQRGEQLGLTDDEVAFYDALEREIDDRGYRLYGLTPQEIQIVEQSGK